jgi:hypothetical protein
MKRCKLVLATFVAVCAAAGAEVVPSINGPELPLSGTLRYDLRYAQIAQFYGGSQGNSQTSSLSGDLSYANSNPAFPFGLTYSGGDLWNISGSGGESGVFQHMLASQGIVRRKWSLQFSDDVDYIPQAPTTGFSGIPGVGDLPSQTTQPGQSVLTLNTRSVTNTTIANLSRSIGRATSLSGGGSYAVLRFPDNNGLEDNQWQANGQISRRLSASDSFFGQYVYSRSTYPGYTIAMDSQSTMFGYTRTWGRRLQTSISMGPEWEKTSGIEVDLLGIMIPLPPSTSSGLSVNASASYATRSTTATLGYFQGTSTGAGVLNSFGTRNKNLSGGISRTFGRNLTIGATGAYMRSQALISEASLAAGSVEPGTATDAEYGGVTATRKWGRYLSFYANYTATEQSSGSTLPTNAISQLSQVIGFGAAYSPRAMHFKR